MPIGDGQASPTGPEVLTTEIVLPMVIPGRDTDVVPELTNLLLHTFPLFCGSYILEGSIDRHDLVPEILLFLVFRTWIVPRRAFLQIFKRCNEKAESLLRDLTALEPSGASMTLFDDAQNIRESDWACRVKILQLKWLQSGVMLKDVAQIFASASYAVQLEGLKHRQHGFPSNACKYNLCVLPVVPQAKFEVMQQRAMRDERSGVVVPSFWLYAQQSVCTWDIRQTLVSKSMDDLLLNRASSVSIRSSRYCSSDILSGTFRGIENAGRETPS